MGGVVKCTEAVKATHTIADGTACAAGEGSKDATWLDLLLKGDIFAWVAAGDASLTTDGGGLVALRAPDLRLLRGGMAS